MTTFTREDYEMAAKAVGLRLIMDAPNGGRPVVTDGAKSFGWNPPEDDGDALRLAVKLGLSRMLITKHGTCSVETTDYMADNPAVVVETCKEGGDPYATTRRAIFRAAIAIGRAMP